MNPENTTVSQLTAMVFLVFHIDSITRLKLSMPVSTKMDGTLPMLPMFILPGLQN